MYLELIRGINFKLDGMSNKLFTIVGNILSDIRKVQDVNSINVSYYTDSEIDNWWFSGESNKHFGYDNVCISRVRDLDDEPVFDMQTEDGEPWGEMYMGDFNVHDLIGLAMMMDDLLEVVREDGEVKE